MKPEKPDLDKLLASPNLNSSIIALDNYICALCNWGDNISSLTFPQKVFYYNQELEREVNNGGFDQYFYNSSGRYANDTIESLKLIGAHQTVKLLQAAIDVFPGKAVPVDGIERRLVLDQIEDSSAELWNELDERFFKYEDDLNTLNMEFVREHKQEF